MPDIMMTAKEIAAGLVERLLAVDPFMNDPISLKPRRRNPDGSDAAAHITALDATLAAKDAEIARLREAVRVLRNGYADAVSGYEYIKQQHGRLDGVGFDRVTDHFFNWVTMPEREGLLAGSHVLPAFATQETEHG